MTRRRFTSPDAAAPSLPQICDFCLARRSPVDGRWLRGCPWLTADMTQHFPSLRGQP